MGRRKKNRILKIILIVNAVLVVGLAAALVLVVTGRFPGLTGGETAATPTPQGTSGSVLVISGNGGNASVTAHPVTTAAAPARQTPAATYTLPGTHTATSVPTAVPTAVPTLVPTPAPTSAVPQTYDGLKVQPSADELFDAPKRLTVVAGSTMNIRTGPKTKYAKLATAELGDELYAYAAKDGWYLVQYRPGSYGWASGSLLFAKWMFEDGTNTSLKDVAAPEGNPDGYTVASVTALEGANLRRGPSTKQKKKKTVGFGESVRVLAKEGSWWLVNAESSFGWAHDSNFSPITASSTGDGEFLYAFGRDAAPKESEFGTLMTVSLLKYVVFTQEEMDRAGNGEPVTKQDVTLTAEIMNDPDTTFQYISSQKGYTFRNGDESYPTYADETALLLFSDMGVILDNNYAVLEYDSFRSSERAIYGFGKNGYGAQFYASALPDYISVLKKHFDSGYYGFTGTVTVKNGVVTRMTNVYMG